MRRPARLLALALALGASLVAASAGAASGPRLRLDQPRAPVDVIICVCTDAPPSQVMHLDGKEEQPPALAAQPADADSPRTVHLAMRWPDRGPLRLGTAIPGRARTQSMPVWGQEGTLGPGVYVLTASGFAAETLRVVAGDAADRRARALLARARLRAEQGDSTLAARLLEQLTDPRVGGPYAADATLALGDLLPFSRYKERPEGWLVEWIARRHNACMVGEGIRVWLAHHGDEAGRATLARIVARYPETRASREARDWLLP